VNLEEIWGNSGEFFSWGTKVVNCRGSGRPLSSKGIWRLRDKCDGGGMTSSHNWKKRGMCGKGYGNARLFVRHQGAERWHFSLARHPGVADLSGLGGRNRGRGGHHKKSCTRKMGMTGLRNHVTLSRGENRTGKILQKEGKKDEEMTESS